MKPYFEEQNIFTYKVACEEGEKYRISVDMGIETFLCFCYNEVMIFHTLYGRDISLPGQKSLAKIKSLIKEAHKLSLERFNTYTGLHPSHFKDEKDHNIFLTTLPMTTYDPEFWESALMAIEYAYPEDKK